MKYTEGRSTGIPKIIRAMKANGSPPAEFEFDEDHTYFMVRLPIHPTALEVAETGSKETETDQVTDQVHRLLKMLGDEVISVVQLMAKLNLSHRPTFRNNYLNPAIEKGLIEMTIPEKPQSSKQKYRLTEKGKLFKSKG